MHTKQEKNRLETPHSAHSRAMQAPIVQVCANRVMDVTFVCARGRKTLQTAWLPYTGKHSGGGGISEGVNQKSGFIVFSMLILFCMFCYCFFFVVVVYNILMKHRYAVDT